MRTVLVLASLALFADATCPRTIAYGDGDKPATGPARPTLSDDLLDRLLGEWSLDRKIGARAARDVVHAEWVLRHQFVRIHMVDAADPDDYEAIVMIGRDDKGYVAHWCDTFGGAFSALGHGARSGNAIEFEFAYPSGPFFNTFTWDESAKSWTFAMETQDAGGRRKPFATDTLHRVQPRLLLQSPTADPVWDWAREVLLAARIPLASFQMNLGEFWLSVDERDFAAARAALIRAHPEIEPRLEKAN